MKPHLDAVRALITGYTSYLLTAPASPPFPYVLIWSSGGRPGVEQTITAARTDIDDLVGVTTVADTAEGVFIAQAAVRAALLPGMLPRSLTVTGRVAVLHLEDAQPARADEQVTITGTNLHPYFAVDMYRLISTPA